VAGAALALAFSNREALAACNPASANNVIATCTGATVDQDGFTGYGSPGIGNVNITVVPVATVTGTHQGLEFNTGSLLNHGTITGQTFDAITAGSSAVVTNYGAILGSFSGISTGTATVQNFGTIIGGNFDGINASVSANVSNSGTISGGDIGIKTSGAATVVNSGMITGAGSYGIQAGTVANVINSGTIFGRQYGMTAPSINVTNSGTIVGNQFSGLNAFSGNVVNSGTIIGGNGIAISFVGAGLSSTLTVLPGARFGGLIEFGGGADTLNFGSGSWIINTANFNAGLSSINAGGNAYFVAGNRIVVADMSGFGAVNRAMLDIAGWMSSVLPDTPVFEPAASNAGNAFAAIESASPQIDEAFASFPSALPYAPTPAFKGGTVQDAAGNTFWAKGFGGRREQDTTGNFLGSITNGFGGAIGYDRRLTPDLQVGGFVGGSNNETKLNANAGSVDIDAVFGGGYVRTFFSASFLDLALIGGRLDNESKRNIGGGLNLETATASFGGWFINPMATLGHRIAFGNGLTLTPAIKVRYLKSHFDSYAETGSSANMTVSGWDSAAFEERAELALASVQYFGGDSRFLFRMAGGALAQQRAGDSSVGLTFAGQSLLALTPDQRRVNGWYGNAGFDWQRGRFAIFAGGEITDTSDFAVTYSGKSGLRIVW
jgi:hypothetical protein